MKNLLSLIVIITGLSLGLMSCNTTKSASETAAQGKNWYKDQSWFKDLKLKPHQSINQEEFLRQYEKNSTYWNEAFNFIKTHDLVDLAPGNYVVDSGNVIAMVVELAPKDSAQVNWENHHNFNDLQYIIKGKAGMGVSSIANPDAKVTVPYSDKSDTEVFAVNGGANYYTADPGTFFIFTPKEIHRPAFKLAGYDNIKKLIIKVRVPQ